uniref:ABC-type glutathione-S-conjugate transporter n=1 Tax=Phlebotomus papatasi TaxID=29031 RepID=A0A1B0DM26_PHLPP
MDEFCGSAFWDANLTWHTNEPDLTPCFQQTVLIWTPCLFLWAFSLIEIYYIRSSRNRDIPWGFLNTTKLAVNCALIVLTSVDLIKAMISKEEGAIYAVHFYTPVIKIATFVLAAVLMYYNKKHGLQTSGLLWLFWFFLFIFSIPQCRTEVRNSNMRNSLAIENSWAEYQYISFMVYFTFLCEMFLLNCFADKRPRVSNYDKDEKPCPELSASFLSRIFFAWFDPLAWRGFRKPLENSDLWNMKPEDSAKEVMPLFAKYWNKTLAKTAEKNKPTPPKATFSKDAASVNFTKPKARKNASILPAIVKAFGPTFLFGAMLKFFQDILTFVSPQVLRLLINFVGTSGDENPEEDWKGIFYTFLLFIVASTQTLFLAQYFNRMFFVGLRIRTALISAIYRKALVMSNNARKESTVGEIVNLMAVDAQRFMDLTAYINMIWSAPLQIGLALYFLWDILGPSVLAGLAVMIILIPVNSVIANKVKTLQIRQMKNKDERVKLMNEVLSGIKVLKLYAWEPSFEEQVLRIREKEVQVLKEQAYLNAGTSFIWSCAPFLTSVSVKRINKFMNSEELDPTNVQQESKENAALVIENGQFSWGGDETVLRDINMRVEKEKVVAVVGTVGSGKSSLVSAYLGELEKLCGRVVTNGRIAYVSQQAWIQNATLQDNILFGKDMDRKRYERVIEACALKPDIEMLPGGDQTEIGEKGINLSGGQKQRVSLARAVYNDADIYFLDDPLSAVDSHVGKHIFEQVVGRNGMLAKKTRLLVTHGITYLPDVDYIYVLKDGEISESGAYQELLNKKGAFAEFLIHHLQENTSDESDNLDELKQQLESVVDNEELRGKLERAISQRSRSESNSETGSLHDTPSRKNSDASADGSILRRRTPEKKDGSTKEKEKLIEQEKSETGSVKWDVYKHYLRSIGMLLSVTTILLNMVFQGFSIGSNVWLARWSTDPNAGNDTGTRDMYLGVYGALGAGQALTNLMASLIMALGCLYAARDMHILLLSNVLRWAMELFDVTPMGRIMNRFSKDVDVVDNILPQKQATQALRVAGRSLSTSETSLLKRLRIRPTGVTSKKVVVGALITLFSNCACIRRAALRAPKYRDNVDRNTVIRSWLFMFFSVLATLVVISISTPLFVAVILPIGLLYYFVQRFYVATSRFIGESEDKVDFNQVCYFPSIIANRWLAVRLEMVGNLIILFAAMFAVLGRDSTDEGSVGLSVSYALQITQTLNWLVRMTSDVETNIVAVERIKEYAETKQEAPWELPNATVPTNWPEVGTVEFKNFQVRYREGLELVLRGIDFVVDGGQKVGIVGRTGAGKSSLTLSLFRIIESAGGSILIDGQDISKLGLHTLRSRLTIIPQDPVLFSGSLRMNLDPFNSHSDDDVWRALEHAHLRAFVKGLTAGLNHEVSEGGENLSVGQRQLVCLARALLRKTKVLILDEATAAVDLETDDLIQRTIRTEFKDCTVLTIAHRLNTILDSDRVIVLDRGQILEFSSPSELLQDKKSAFYSMAKDANLV